MARTAINLYSVRALDEPLLAVLDRVADAGYDGVQFSGGGGDATVPAVRSKLDETALDVAAAHVGLEALEADLDATAAAYASVGCDGVVVPYLEEANFESVDAIQAAADRLSALVGRLADRGLALHYHNHAHEFDTVEGERALDRLLAAAPAVGLELDVGWAAAAGDDPVARIERFGDRIALLHAKDMRLDPRAFAEIGEGDVPMADCLAAATAAGVDWLVYEHDDPADPVASIERGAAYLDAYR